MILGLDNVGVAVRDVARSAAFYRLLGFEPEYLADDSAFLRAAGVALYLFRTRGPQPSPRSFDLEGNPVGYDHLSFQVADVDGVCGKLQGLGVVVEREPQDYPWGARAACLRDPDGNCVWLLQRNR